MIFYDAPTAGLRVAINEKGSTMGFAAKSLIVDDFDLYQKTFSRKGFPSIPWKDGQVIGSETYTLPFGTFEQVLDDSPEPVQAWNFDSDQIPEGAIVFAWTAYDQDTKRSKWIPATLVKESGRVCYYPDGHFEPPYVMAWTLSVTPDPTPRRRRV